MGKLAWFSGIVNGIVIVETAEEFGDGGDAEEVVGVGEEAHAGDDDGGHVIPLCFGGIEGV